MLLRWLTIIATSYAVLFCGPGSGTPSLAALVILFVLSNVALHRAPEQWLRSNIVLIGVVVFDSAVTSLMLLLSPQVEQNIVILYFFVMLVAAIGSSLRAMVAASTAMSALYLFVMWRTHGPAYLLQSEVLLRVPFLFCASLFYGYLAETARRSGNELFRAIFASSLDAIAVNRLDDGRYVEVNDEFLRLSGFDRSEVIGRTPEELSFWEDSRVYREAVRRLAACESVRNLETWFRAKRGQRVHALISSCVAMLDGEPCVLSCMRDVTDLDEAQRGLRENEERFRQLAENVDGACWILSLEPTRLIYMSPAYEKIWGRPVGTSPDAFAEISESLHPEDRERVEAALERWVESAGGSPLSEQFRVVHPSGVIRWVWARGFRIRDAEGRIYRLGGISQDITELKQLEQQLLQSLKLDAIGRLAGGVAHDFNNLLTIIQGSASLLRLRLPADPQMQDDLEAIDDAASRAADLTRQLLSFARGGVHAARVLDVNERIGGMHRILRRIIGEDVELTCRLAPGLGKIRLDPGRLEQVLVNLAVNAREAMPRGGRLAIETENVPAPVPGAVDARTTPDGYVRITVTDDGCGMSEDVKAHLFEPFFTTKAAKGTGLGLATCYGIVTQAGGRVTIESEPGHGASFRFDFPRVPEEACGALERTAQPAPPPPGTESVLLVEDEPLVRRVAARTLREHGYSVFEAGSGEDAMSFVERGGNPPIQLLLSDIVLPGRRGTEVAGWLRRRMPAVRVLLMSGYAEGASLDLDGRDSPESFLQKPFTPDALIRKVREVLDAPPARVPG